MPTSVVVRLDTAKLDRLIARFDGNTDKAVAAIAQQAEGHVKAIIVEKHIIDTGALLNSIHVEPKRREKWRTVADGVEYGFAHEFGTMRIGARPFMLPGLLRAARGFAAEVGKWCFD